MKNKEQGSRNTLRNTLRNTSRNTSRNNLRSHFKGPGRGPGFCFLQSDLFIYWGGPWGPEEYGPPNGASGPIRDSGTHTAPWGAQHSVKGHHLLRAGVYFEMNPGFWPALVRSLPRARSYSSSLGPIGAPWAPPGHRRSHGDPWAPMG